MQEIVQMLDMVMILPDTDIRLNCCKLNSFFGFKELFALSLDIIYPDEFFFLHTISLFDSIHSILQFSDITTMSC